MEATVRALQFRDNGNCTLSADVPWGQYHIAVDCDDNTRVEWLEANEECEQWVAADSVEAAKVACQSHYKAVVLSCLEESPRGASPERKAARLESYREFLDERAIRLEAFGKDLGSIAKVQRQHF